MSKRDPSLLVEDIIDSANKILDYTANFSFEEFTKDGKTIDAVIRNFEIIGEAASRLSEAFKMQYPEIEWRILKDFRNFIIHEYFGINSSIVWDTIQFRLPHLLQDISTIIKNLK